MKTKTNAMEGVVVSYNVVVKTLTAEEKRILAQHEAMHRALDTLAKTVNPLDEYRGDIPRTPVLHDLLYKKETVMNVKDLVGKTVAHVEYKDPWGEGITLRFSDGTVLFINEYMQAGEIEVRINGKTMEYEGNGDD